MCAIIKALALAALGDLWIETEPPRQDTLDFAHGTGVTAAIGKRKEPLCMPHKNAFGQKIWRERSKTGNVVDISQWCLGIRTRLRKIGALSQKHTTTSASCIPWVDKRPAKWQRTALKYACPPRKPVQGVESMPLSLLPSSDPGICEASALASLFGFGMISPTAEPNDCKKREAETAIICRRSNQTHSETAPATTLSSVWNTCLFVY